MDEAAAQLQKAVLTRDVESVRRLLAAAPDAAALVAAQDRLRQNALHWAAFDRSPAGPEIVRLLLNVSPAPATACDSLGSTPAHYAAAMVCPVSLLMLLSAAPSAAVLAATPDLIGRCLLHYVVEWSGPELVRQLLDLAPACVAAKGCELYTPLDLLLRPAMHLRLTARELAIARLLIATPGQEPRRLLHSLNLGGSGSLPLYADVAARCPLTPADWSLVPSPCPAWPPPCPRYSSARRQRQHCWWHACLRLSAAACTLLPNACTERRRCEAWRCRSRWCGVSWRPPLLD